VQSREAVAGALDRVYARPEFAERTLPPLLQALADAWAAFRLWLASLLPGLSTIEVWGPLLLRLIVALLALVAAGAVWYLLSELARAYARPERRPASPAGSLAAAGGVLPRDAAGWEAAAWAAAAAGRLRAAALALYHAALLRLQERGAVRVHEGKTPGDYRREARARPELADVAREFDRFVRMFLPLAFGARAPDRAGWDALVAAAAGVGVRPPDAGSAHA
jgi:hypothetical protein